MLNSEVYQDTVHVRACVRVRACVCACVCVTSDSDVSEIIMYNENLYITYIVCNNTAVYVYN